MAVPHVHISAPVSLCPMLCPPCPVPEGLPTQVKQERPLPSPGSQGMLDRSRMALCAFVFLCLSFNPLASLLRGSSAPTPVGSPGTAGPGRSIMAEPGTAGKRWHGVEAVGG